MYIEKEDIKISVIICTHNRHDVLIEAISSIELQSLNYKYFELIIVDNSTDQEIQRSTYENITIKCNGEYIIESKSGLSNARNIGIKSAKGEYIAFLDDDALAEPNWLEKIVKLFESDVQIAVLGGPVEPIWPYDKPYWLHEWQEGYLTILNRGNVERDLEPNEWLAGTNIAFRKTFLLEAGGFDASLGRTGKLLLSNEELMITKKIIDLGGRAMYSPAIKVKHRVHEDRLTQDWFRRRAAWQVVSDLLSDNSNQLNKLQRFSALDDFLSKLPIRQRNLASVFMTVKTKQDFQRQIAAVEAIIYIMLTEPSNGT